MTDVTIQNLTKSYGALTVIRDQTLEIKNGEFVVLVGPSGCGKSTLLRMIAGLEEITGGTISIDGRVVNDVKPKDRDIAMVFQNYALYPQMTVAQNMGFSLEMARLAKTEIAEKVQAAAEILDLTPLLDRKPAQLSGGQRQRVAMGRAIVRDPKVFLFDEPLSNLDAKLRVQMRAEIKALHARLKSTVIYVTHDQVEAMTMADKIVVVRDGSIEQVGAPLALYDNPANTFVAGFLGAPSTNFFEAKATRNGVLIETQMEMAIAHDIEEGRDLILGVRPENIAVGRDGAMQGVVEIVEPTGAETLVTCRVFGKPTRALLRDRRPVAVGDVVSLGFEAADLRLFDRASENRIAAAG